MPRHIRSSPATDGYFPALTGIRAVAALMVYFHHFNPFTGPMFGKFIPAFIAEFHVGVTIFFVLSGFLISYRYEELFRIKQMRWRDYFVNRFGRIYPVYFLATIVVFLPFYCHCVFSAQLPVLFLNLSFLRGFFSDYRDTGISAGWSLTVEELFYFLFPLIVGFSRRISLWLQAVAGLSFGIGLVFLFRDLSFHGFFSSFQFLFEFTFFGRCFEFFTGIFLARTVRKKGIPNQVPGKSRCTLVGAAWIAVCIAGLAVNKAVLREGGWWLSAETLLNNFILPPGIALLFYGLLSERSAARWVLSSSLFSALGKSSYVFYLIHIPLFAVLYFRWGQHPLPVLLVITVIAWLIYIGVEQPLNRLIRRKFEGRRSSASTISLSQSR